ncbi:hypothetical protein JCM11251_006169 [Rhodosporidiobolus azoricus]
MQGFNKYYPPDYDPEKHTSLNSYHGKHALGDRARKIDQGILVVRFELPYNIWCNHCSAHVGQGVRYNAEKKKVGNYYSTPIWSFRFKCHLCSGRIEIRTDPQNTRYVVTEGARQKMEEAEDPERDGMLVIDTSAGEASANPDAPPDPFASLEKTTVQKERALSTSARLSALHEQNATHWDDPFSASRKLRATFRAKKKDIVASEGKARELADRYALGGEGRLRLEDFRTPKRGSTEEEEEEREWREARRRRGEVEAEEGRKRRREEGRLLGREAIGKTPRLTSSSSAPGAGERARASSFTASSTSSRPSAAMPRSCSSSSALTTLTRPSSSSSSHAPTASPAARSLHSKLALASALKRDPFATVGSPSSSMSSSSSGLPGSKGEKMRMSSSRSAPEGLAGLARGGLTGGAGVGVKVKRAG